LGFQNPQSRQASSQAIALAQAAGNASSPSTESSGERALKNPIRRRRLLRADGERPGRRAAEQSDKRACSFDHFVGAGKEGFRNRGAHSLRCLEIDGQLELRGLLYG
jgi:hypothetical protein